MSNILKHHRKKSKFEVINHFYDLQHYIYGLMLDDFGFREAKYEEHVKETTGHKPIESMTEEEYEKYTMLLTRKNGLSTWLIDKFRTSIYNILDTILSNIIIANSTFPSTVEDYELRIKHEKNAIIYCEYLFQKLNSIIFELPVNKNKFSVPADMIMYEIELIKGWKDSDKKSMKKLLK